MFSHPCARLAALLVAILASLAPIGRAADYDESVDGDLSGVPDSPTLWTLEAGANRLVGLSGFHDSMFDYDLVSFTIPEGMQLDSIAVNHFENEFGVSFFGIQPGTPWLDDLGFAITGQYLSGWVHVANEDNLSELLDAFNVFLPEELTVPLPASTQTLLIQDPDGFVEYDLTFNVSAVGGTPGDFNGDNRVDGADLAQWIDDFGVDNGSDADGDGDSDGKDFLVWQEHFGTGVMAAGAVPEPTAAQLVACAWLLAGAARMRRRQR